MSRSHQRFARRLVPIAVALCLAGAVQGRTFPRDLQVDVFVNQVGFPPSARKVCVLEPGRASTF
jgi:hypothetical protein